MHIVISILCYNKRKWQLKLFYDLLCFNCMSMCVYMCVYTCVYRVLVITVALRGQEGMGPPGVGVTSACEPCDMCRNYTQVLCRGHRVLLTVAISPAP